MPVRPALLFVVSVLTACFSVYHIFALTLGFTQSAERVVNGVISESSGVLLLNYTFWFWVFLVWVSAYLLIKNYIILSELITRS
jgi:hypothetical protein